MNREIDPDRLFGEDVGIAGEEELTEAKQAAGVGDSARLEALVSLYEKGDESRGIKPDPKLAEYYRTRLSEQRPPTAGIEVLSPESVPEIQQNELLEKLHPKDFIDLPGIEIPSNLRENPFFCVFWRQVIFAAKRLPDFQQANFESFFQASLYSRVWLFELRDENLNPWRELFVRAQEYARTVPDSEKFVRKEPISQIQGEDRLVNFKIALPTQGREKINWSERLLKENPQMCAVVESYLGATGFVPSSRTQAREFAYPSNQTTEIYHIFMHTRASYQNKEMLGSNVDEREFAKLSAFLDEYFEKNFPKSAEDTERERLDNVRSIQEDLEIQARRARQQTEGAEYTARIKEDEAKIVAAIKEKCQKIMEREGQKVSVAVNNFYQDSQVGDFDETQWLTEQRKENPQLSEFVFQDVTAILRDFSGKIFGFKNAGIDRNGFFLGAEVENGQYIVLAPTRKNLFVARNSRLLLERMMDITLASASLAGTQAEKKLRDIEHFSFKNVI